MDNFWCFMPITVRLTARCMFQNTSGNVTERKLKCWKNLFVQERQTWGENELGWMEWQEMQCNIEHMPWLSSPCQCFVCVYHIQHRFNGSFYGNVRFSVSSFYRNITLEKHFRLIFIFENELYVIWTITPWAVVFCYLKYNNQCRNIKYMK